MKCLALKTVSAILYLGALVAWPIWAVSDDRQDIVRKIHSEILASFPKYQSIREGKALAGCINWDLSTPLNLYIPLLRGQSTAVWSDAPVFASKLMRAALQACERARAKEGSNCECMAVDKNGKPALKVPSSFIEKFRPAT